MLTTEKNVIAIRSPHMTKTAASISRGTHKRLIDILDPTPRFRLLMRLDLPAGVTSRLLPSQRRNNDRIVKGPLGSKLGMT